MDSSFVRSQVLRSLRRNVYVASFAVIAIGLAVSVGWTFDVSLLKMEASTAICFVLAGTALLCLLCENRRWRRLGQVLAVLVLTTGVVNIAVPDHMAGISAFEFILVGISLLPVNTRVGWRLLASQLLALTATAISLLVLIGYHYGQESFATAAAFFILGLGIVSTRPHCYIMRHVTSDAIGGVIARRLLPFAILVPILVGWIHLRLHDNLLGSFRLNESVEVLVVSIIFVVSTIWFAMWLNRSDIERLRQEQQRLQGDRRMQLVGKELTDAVMDWNLMTNEVWFSETFYTFFGYSPKKVTASIEFWKEGICPEDKVRVLADMKTFIEDGQESYSCEYRFRSENGAYTNILARNYLVRDSTGAAMHMVCAMIDMTKKKRLEEIQREREIIESRYRFVSMISHELRSPMTVIQNAIELVDDETDGPVNVAQRRHLNMAKHHLDRLGRLLNDALDFQKMEMGRMELHPSEQDINTIIMDVASTFQDEAKKKEMQIDLHLSAGLPEILCDRDAMEQVMTNLLSNAIKYSNHGHVDVRSMRNGDCLRISVHDDGIGIRKEDQAKLFQGFCRIYNPDSPRTEGTGLGLAICKKIVEASHGQIGVDSDPGQGSTFYFTMPITQSGQKKSHAVNLGPNL